MLYSKELRDWTAQIQSSSHAAAALKGKNNPNASGGSFIRELVIRERHDAPAIPAPSPSQALADKLWDDIDSKAGKLGTVLPLITQERIPQVVDIMAEDEE